MNLSLLFVFTARDCLSDSPEQIKSPKTEIRKKFFIFDLVQNCPFSVINSWEVRITINDRLLHALKIQTNDSTLQKFPENMD